MNALQILLVLMAMHSIESGVRPRPHPPNAKVTNAKWRGIKEPSPPDNSSSFLGEFLLVGDFQKYAERNMDKKRLSYIQSGAMLEQTLRENTDAFLRIQLLPKYLRNTEKMDLTTSILGHRVSLPIGICPNAIQQVEHPDGETATARAAATEDTVIILSMHSSFSLEEVAASAPSGHRWFQVRNFYNRTITEDLVRRAKRAGFKAIVLTVDAPVEGSRISYMRTKFSFNDYRQGNFEKYVSSENFQGAFQLDPSKTWTVVRRLKEISGLPLVVKGILTAHDAKLAVENGADAIIVSNHGGRQLDGVPATIEALPEVVQAVNGRVEVYLDSGVRTGTDVIKALALGARAVFIGRPNLYGLFAAGENGSRKVVQLLKNELLDGMHLIGVHEPSQLNSSYLRRAGCCRR